MKNLIQNFILSYLSKQKQSSNDPQLSTVVEIRLPVIEKRKAKGAGGYRRFELEYKGSALQLEHHKPCRFQNKNDGKQVQNYIGYLSRIMNILTKVSYEQAASSARRTYGNEGLGNIRRFLSSLKSMKGNKLMTQILHFLP